MRAIRVLHSTGNVTCVVFDWLKRDSSVVLSAAHVPFGLHRYVPTTPGLVPAGARQSTLCCDAQPVTSNNERIAIRMRPMIKDSSSSVLHRRNTARERTVDAGVEGFDVRARLNGLEKFTGDSGRRRHERGDGE